MLTVKSNSPLQSPPSDYCPSGSDNWFTLSTGNDKGKQLFYYDYSNSDQPEQTVVFVHGNPESSYTYRHIRDCLIAAQTSIRIIAMDHIGFGLSDQASYEMVDMHHASNLLQLIKHLDLQAVTLVLHDWGGPIGAGAFIQEPHRVKNLVVMNTTVFPMPEAGFTYKNYPFSWLPWSKTPYMVPDSLWGGIAAYVVSNAAPQSGVKFVYQAIKMAFKHGLSLVDRGTPEYVWSQMLRSKANAISSKRNVLQTPVWGHGYQYRDSVIGNVDNTNFYQHLQQHLCLSWGEQGKNIPAVGFFGQWDACGKDEVIEQWQQALPQMKNATYTYADVGHFIEEYKYQEIAEAILSLNNLHSG